ncbi:MAG: beta-propeller fold lactonase family protein [Alphaproteobacteria bacterium GM7ARS4]|nr:beta-propeller fold lactonase family protein [Alphaproteobacteria bacterium GM7ARS4]
MLLRGGLLRGGLMGVAFLVAGLMASLFAFAETRALEGGRHDYAVVTSQGSSTLSLIDRERHGVVAEIAVPLSPAGVAVAGRYAYIASTKARAITQWDLWQRRLVARRDMASEPLGIAVHKDKLAVAMWYDGEVMILDAHDLTIESVIKVGVEPAGVDFKADGAMLYVSNRGDDSLSVIHMGMMKEIERVPVGDAPFGVTIDDEGRYIYVANVRSHSVSVVEAESYRLRGHIAVGSRPYAIAVERGGRRAFVTNQDEGSISVIDGEAMAERQRVHVGGYPEGIELDEERGLMYVANWLDDEVILMDVKGLRVDRRIAVGEGVRAFGRFLTWQ